MTLFRDNKFHIIVLEIHVYRYCLNIRVRVVHSDKVIYLFLKN